MGSGGKGGGDGAKVYDYFGTIAGLVCAGPVDELVEIIVDGKTAWPVASAWVSGTAYSVGNLVQDKRVVYQCTTAHTASAGNRPPASTHWTRYSLKRATSANPVAVTVEGYGMAYLYWGTASQTLDTVGEVTLNTKGHPPYRRQCFVVLKDFLFGRERTSAPNVEVIVRRNPSQSIVTGDAAGLSDGQANPVAALADLYTDPVFGAGLTANAIGGPDSTSWNATAAALHNDADEFAISPIVQRGQTLRQITAALLGYYDGWVRFSSAGTIEAGRFPHNAAPPTFTPATTIDFHDLIEEVGYNADGWGQTVNQTAVKFVDRQRGYKDASVAAVNGYNLAVTGEPRSVSVDRPWITRRQQASDHAAELAKVNAEPRLSGSLVVRAEKAASIRQGDQFLLTQDALGVSIVCRCLSKDIAQPPAGRVTLQFEGDRAAAPVPFQPTPTADEGAGFGDNETLSLQQFFQPPPPLFEGDQDGTVVPLIARRSPLTTSAGVWLRQADQSGFYRLGAVTQFAIYGTLHQNYAPTLSLASASRARASNVATIATASAHGWVPGMRVTITGMGGTGYNGTATIIATPTATTFTYASTGGDESTTTDTAGTIEPVNDDVTETLRLTLDANTDAGDLAKMLATQTEDAIEDNAVLVILFDQSNPKTFEILTLRAMRIVGADTFYRLKVRRNRYGTTRRNAVTGDRAFIVARADLVPVYAEQFLGLLAVQGVATFRLQSGNAESVADLADAALCPNITYQFADTYAPTFTFDSVKAAGVEITDFTTDYSTTTDFTVQASLADLSADLVEGRLYAVIGTTEVTLWSQTFTPRAAYSVTVAFRLPSVGEWTVFLQGRDASGRVTRLQMTDGGGTTPRTLKVGVGSGSTVVANPTANPPTATARITNVILSCSTAGATIKYRTQTSGGSWSSWSTYIGFVTISMNYGQSVKLQAYAEKSGLTTSQTVEWIYYA